VMAISASACGKVILLGEHAVVYGQPALAIPFPRLRAYAHLDEHPGSEGITIEASDFGRRIRYPAVAADPKDLLVTGLQTTLTNALVALGMQRTPPLLIGLHSELPPARGLGSGTAITIALIRALGAYAGLTLSFDMVSELAYRTEIVYHGHPSGIDNTVIASERPVYYHRGKPLELLEHIPGFSLIVADSGVASQTRTAVEQVHLAWQAQPRRYEELFERIGCLTTAGKSALEAGNWTRLGCLMTANQRLLSELGVSSPILENLIERAMQAGALGAKLSGGGQGGCIIALVDAASADTVSNALRAAGASQVWLVDGHNVNRD